MAGEVSAATPSLTPALAEAELRELRSDSWLPARRGCEVMRVVRMVVVVVVDVWPPSRATLCRGANRPCRARHRKYLGVRGPQVWRGNDPIHTGCKSQL